MVEHKPVTFTVMGVERVRAGALVGLAIVEVDIGGIIMLLQGVQMFRTPGGGIKVRSPQFRDASGTWRSAVIFPESLQNAIADELFAECKTFSV